MVQNHSLGSYKIQDECKGRHRDKFLISASIRIRRSESTGCVRRYPALVRPFNRLNGIGFSSSSEFAFSILCLQKLTAVLGSKPILANNLADFGQTSDDRMDNLPQPHEIGFGFHSTGLAAAVDRLQCIASSYQASFNCSFERVLEKRSKSHH